MPYNTENARSKRHIVDKGHIEGAAKQVKGTVKEAVRKVTGDTKTEADGKGRIRRRRLIKALERRVGSDLRPPTPL
jgi:hypothetical protein